MVDTNKNKPSNIQVPENLKISKIITYLGYTWVYLGIFTLTLRVFLLATSANLSNSFSNFIMRTSADYLRPFRGIFPQSQVSDTGYLDISALFAIIIYLFIAWVFKSLIDYINGRISLSVERQKQAMNAANSEASSSRKPRSTSRS